MRTRRDIVSAISAVPLLALARGSSRAQSYPERTVRIIVPFAAGGSLDGAPRIVSQYISGRTGWPIVIENRVGGGGQVGTLAGKNAPADGYNLIAINGVSHGSALALKRDVGYDPINDFVPIILLAAAPLVLLVRSELGVSSLAEFIEFIKKNPGKLNYGSGGVGTQHHLAVAMLFDQSKLPGDIAAHVPYQGLALAINDLISGSVQFMISSIGPASQHVTSGRLRPLAISSRNRVPHLPEVPTMIELGLKDFEMLAWSGLAAPVGTPPDIIRRWNNESNTALKDETVRKQLANFDFETYGGSPEDFRQFILQEQTRYLNLGKNTGLLSSR
jgi:tripartite-type tricarboxylate transporter receptor subunit TctC